MRTKGIKSSIAPRVMRPRSSRHGKPLADVYTVTTPAKVDRKVVLNEATGEYDVVLVTTQKATTRQMSDAEIAEARGRIHRATSPTTSGWDKNVGGTKSGKKVKG